MKFRISQSDSPTPSAPLQNILSEVFWDKALDSWAIKIRGLPTLLGLMRKVDRPIILTLGHGGDPPTIEIYDDYRE